MLRIALVSVFVMTASCAAQPQKIAVPEPVNVHVEEAELPYQILRSNGVEVSSEAFYAELGAAQAVCIGESHSDPHHHWAQLQLLERLAIKGSKFATGMEMFGRPFQAVIDEFVAGRLTEKGLLERTDWKKRWSFDWELYAPLVRLTVERGGQLLALNVSNELRDKWKRRDDVALSDKDQIKIPSVDLSDKEHRSWFRFLMESMRKDHGDKSGHTYPGASGGAGPAKHKAPIPTPPAHEPKEAPAHKAPTDPGLASVKKETKPDFIDSIYPVQVLWDETMATTGAEWLKEDAERRLIIIAGNGHCHDSAIVGRMKSRGVDKVISVRPVIETGAGEVADLIAAPQNDFLFVMRRSD